MEVMCDKSSAVAAFRSRWASAEVDSTLLQSSALPVSETNAHQSHLTSWLKALPIHHDLVSKASLRIPCYFRTISTAQLQTQHGCILGVPSKGNGGCQSNL